MAVRSSMPKSIFACSCVKDANGSYLRKYFLARACLPMHDISVFRSSWLASAVESINVRVQSNVHQMQEKYAVGTTCHNGPWLSLHISHSGNVMLTK